MKLLENLYKWISGSMSDFTKTFKENDKMFQQAQRFWKQLDNSMLVPVIMFVLLGIGFAYYYYKPFNDVPGRHYKPKYWAIFGGATFVIVFLLTFAYEYYLVGHNVPGSGMLECRIAIGNALYALFVYLLTSFVWCNAFPTNAYRLFKF